MVSSDTTVSSPFSTGEQVGSHLGERGQLPKSKFSREQWLRSASDLLFSLSNSTTHERCSLAHSRKALMESCHLLDLGHRSCSEKTLSGLLRWAAHLNTPATFCKWMNNSFCWNFPDLHSLKQTPGLPNFGQVLKNGKVKWNRSWVAVMGRVWWLQYYTAEPEMPLSGLGCKHTGQGSI